MLGQGTRVGAPADDWATSWRRHIYLEGLRAVPVGALPAFPALTFGLSHLPSGPTCRACLCAMALFWWFGFVQLKEKIFSRGCAVGSR